MKLQQVNIPTSQEELEALQNTADPNNEYVDFYLIELENRTFATGYLEVYDEVRFSVIDHKGADQPFYYDNSQNTYEIIGISKIVAGEESEDDNTCNYTAREGNVISLAHLNDDERGVLIRMAGEANEKDNCEEFAQWGRDYLAKYKAKNPSYHKETIDAIFTDLYRRMKFGSD